MQEDLKAQEDARIAAESDREQAAIQLKDAGTRSEEIVAAAVKEAGSRKELILSEAKKEADTVRTKAREQMEAERQAMYSDMQKEMVEVAMAAAGKLLMKDNAEELDQKAIDAFVKEATDGE
jgi:F-type H+-transporting ATPase subunit b